MAKKSAYKRVIAATAKGARSTQIEVERILDEYHEQVIKMLREEGRVFAKGFGVYKVRQRKAFKRAAAASGPACLRTPVDVPAKDRATFRPTFEI